MQTPRISVFGILLGLITLLMSWLLLLTLFVYLFGSDIISEIVASLRSEEYVIGSGLSTIELRIFYISELILPFLLGGFVIGRIAKVSEITNAVLLPAVIYVPAMIYFGAGLFLAMWWAIDAILASIGGYLAILMKRGMRSESNNAAQSDAAEPRGWP